jgi:hypothetical protein
MDQVLILHLAPKDEWPGADGQPAPGYEPDPAEVAQYVQDELADGTKRDERIGWRLIAVVTAMPVLEIAAHWDVMASLADVHGTARSREAAAYRRCATELRRRLAP